MKPHPCLVCSETEMTDSPKYHLNSPLKPTWRRYREIFIRSSGLSIYRMLEYEALSQLDYSGRVLDFGGGNKAHYVNDFKSWLQDGSYESINIAEEMEPTYLVARGGAFPIDADTFDMVLSVNTLEHVYEMDIALREIVRVLKPGGRIVFAVPFLFRVHGSPDDYNRPTPSWWFETLTRLGITELQITPLVWDIMTTGLSLTESSGPFRRLRRILVPLYGLLYAKIKAPGPGERYPGPIGEALANGALGYIITGAKQQ